MGPKTLCLLRDRAAGCLAEMRCIRGDDADDDEARSPGHVMANRHGERRARESFWRALAGGRDHGRGLTNDV